MKKLTPIEMKKVWGAEYWLASTHKAAKQADFAQIAPDFPLIVKIIDAKEALSVQVHPDDEAARRLEGENERGKTECWLVLDAEEGAKLVDGIFPQVTRDEVAKSIENGTLEAKLHAVEVKKGDFVFIPAGKVHAIGGGLRLLEVQQSSDTTYRLYDYNRGRELHVRKGLEAMKTFPIRNIEPFGESFSCDYFSLERVAVKNRAEIAVSEGIQLIFILQCENCELISGETKLFAHKEELIALEKGEKATLSGECEAIIIKAK